MALADVATAAAIPWAVPTTKPTTPPAPHPLFPRDGGGLGGIVARLAFAPAGGLLAVVSRQERPELLLWDTSIRPPAGPRTVPLDGHDPAALAWSRDAARLAVLDAMGRPQVFDVATGRPLFPPPAHPAGLSALAVAPDGGSVVLADAFDAVDRWDLTTGARLAVAHQRSAGSLVDTPHDGLLVGSVVGGVTRLDPATLTVTATLPAAARRRPTPTPWPAATPTSPRSPPSPPMAASPFTRSAARRPWPGPSPPASGCGSRPT